jgi:hypothetical protein
MTPMPPGLIIRRALAGDVSLSYTKIDKENPYVCTYSGSDEG